MNKQIKKKLSVFPQKPGIYIMKNANGKVIYVGKAKKLKNRVNQYFRGGKISDAKTSALVSRIADIDYIVTDTEAEALILENNLIKKHKPKYNILLKDDKTYPYIKLCKNENYPYLQLTRKIEKDNAEYFGPFTSSLAVKETIDILNNAFMLRKCRKSIKGKDASKRECLNYHIGLCSAPCAGKISVEDYLISFTHAASFLQGKSLFAIKTLKDKMAKYSESLQYEKAALARDSIKALEHIISGQKVASPDGSEFDAVAVYGEDNTACFCVLFIRGGKLLGSRKLFASSSGSNDTFELAAELIKQFYNDEKYIPQIIVSRDMPKDCEDINHYLTAVSGHKSEVKVYERGIRKSLADLAYINAKEALIQKKGKRNHEMLYRLKELLGIETIPQRIEVYDISNTSGSDTVGVMAVFENGRAKRSDFRKFKVKTVGNSNDYEAMREVIYRRVMRLDSDSGNTDKAFAAVPDLIFVDGGMAHTSVIRQMLTALNINIPVFGLVKDNRHRTRGIVNDKRGMNVKKNTDIFRFVSKMQETTHNSAIKYHHSTRSKNIIKSELENIKGIGPQKRKKLFDTFKSVNKIKSAGYDELTKCVGKSCADNIIEYFREGSSSY